jgi:hypothetical protein
MVPVLLLVSAHFLQKGNCRLNLRKHSFKNRVTDIWNDLLEELVQAKTVKSFEILLDKYWENQEVECDYNEEIKVKTGSVLNVSIILQRWHFELFQPVSVTQLFQ